MSEESRLGEREVVACRAESARYPVTPPFSPDQAWPEYPFEHVGEEPNGVYEAVRRSFQLAGLDAARLGSPVWNPLGALISPGETVVLKPNLVAETHPRDREGWRYVLTNGSIVRAVADYVFLAVGAGGRVVLADAPQTDSSFSAMVRLLGLDALRDFYAGAGLELELVDLRQEEWVNRDGVIVSRFQLPGDPGGAVAFDLGDMSEFADHRGAGRYYGADYDARPVNDHHSDGRHEYLLSATAVQADVLFSLPKLKTHKKAGITDSIKNLVGLNADKNWLPHHTEGSPPTGGDEVPSADVTHRLERALARGFRTLSLRVPGASSLLHRRARWLGLRVFGDGERVVRSGNWWGNDTVWRMCLDLNRILLYGKPDAALRPMGPGGRKRHFVLVDGVIAGQGRGPTDPDPVDAGLVVFGLHPASVDAACARLMGFDPERIPIVREAFRPGPLSLAEWGWREVSLVSDRPEWNGLLGTLPADATFSFAPHFGWTGHIEYDAGDGSRSAERAVDGVTPGV